MLNYTYELKSSLPIITQVFNNTTLNTLFSINTNFDIKRGNLLSRTNSLFGFTEVFNYDQLDRLTEYTNVISGQRETQSYDNKGRITSNKVGDYQYNTTKKYQVSNIDLSTESKSYYQERPLLEVDYNTFKNPVSIHEENKEDLFFDYNGAGQRTVMYYGNIADTKEQSLYKRYYSSDGSVEITFNTQNQHLDYVYYADGNAYSATVIAKQTDTQSSSQFYYFHRDYLGSIIAITDQQGSIVEKRHFDAWGTPVKIMNGQGDVLDKLTFTDRGYTGHEHLQGINIIHMNGRLYDPYLRRFMAPDNYVQDPTNTQNFNRYSYVLNNPLKYTDPSGEIVISFGASVLIGAIVAATTYTVTALYANVPFSAEGLLKNTIFGAVSAAASFGVGEIFQITKAAEAALTTQQAIARMSLQALAHGVTQGSIAAIQGGDFLSSFSSAALSSMLAGGFYKYGGDFVKKDFVSITFSTASAGGVSALTGGNFWQGAAIGLYVSALNHAAHKSDVDDDIVRINTKDKTATVERTRDGHDRIFVDGKEIMATPKGALGPELRGAGYDISMIGPQGVGMGLTDFVLDAFNLITGVKQFKMGVTILSKSSLSLPVVNGASKGTLQSSFYYSRTLGINSKMPIRMPTIVGAPTRNLGIFIGRNSSIIGAARMTSGGYGILNNN